MLESFEQWCIATDHLMLLDRWDYDKNTFLPSEISKGTEKKIWFKCPNGIHESEQAQICGLTYGRCKDISCKKCNSFAQHYIDRYGVEEFNKVWNIDNTVDPWKISYQSRNKVILNCVNNADHIYERWVATCFDINTCPICEKQNRSVGVKYPEIFNYWSDINDTTPFDYSPMVTTCVWFKCNNNLHGDYMIGIKTAVQNNFICPNCKEKQYHPKPGLRLRLEGKQFGELTVIKFDGMRGDSSFWECLCSCGEKVVVRGCLLTKGNTVTCGNKSFHKTGENNPNWKGGITPENIMIRQSKEYAEWRNSIYNKDGYSCVVCGTHQNLNAHHIYPFADFIEKRLDINNGITLCENHHSTQIEGGFHNIYGTSNNTPEQLEEYINAKRVELGINEHFDINEYMKGIKEMENKVKWNHEFYTDEELNSYLDNDIQEPMSAYVYRNRKSSDDESVYINNKNKSGKFQHILPKYRVNNNW